MRDKFQCPICKANQWKIVGTHLYFANEHQNGGKFYNDQYVRIRRRVLFEVWFPNFSHVELRSCYCKQCGFMCYHPRPDVNDICAKYNFLGKIEVNIGGIHNTSKLTIQMEKRRAERVYKTVNKVSSIREGAVLDVGGGDGRLLSPFQLRNYNCFIVDYNPSPKPGIKRLGLTIEDIPVNMHFDIIICSHVLEHVADPVDFLSQILQHVKKKGIVYIEVPLEIWIDIPIKSEPVTHINFFTEISLINTLYMANFNVIRSKTFIGSYCDRRRPVIWALAKGSLPSCQKLLKGGQLTEKFIKPSCLKKIKREFFEEIIITHSYRPILKFLLRILKRVKKIITKLEQNT